jgi:hypothetical protein
VKERVHSKEEYVKEEGNYLFDASHANTTMGCSASKSATDVAVSSSAGAAAAGTRKEVINNQQAVQQSNGTLSLFAVRLLRVAWLVPSIALPDCLLLQCLIE